MTTEPTDRESYEGDPIHCEICGETFVPRPEDNGGARCSACDDWSDLEGLMF